MAVTADKPAPYATPTAILDLIERYRNRGLPSPIDSDVLGRAGIATTLIPRTLQSLQTLDLIDRDTGAPTAALEALRLAPESEYRGRLGEWLKGAYADVFAFVDPMKDDETRVRDAFRSYQPVGQQGRMVVLFQGLCAAAGLCAEKSAAPRPAVSRPNGRTRPPPAPALKRISPPNLTFHKQTSPGLPAPLAGLLTSLPAEGGGWTKDAREKFLTTFTTVLDFCVPVIEGEPPMKENGGQT
jgi:hypothetical protein